MTPLDAGMRVPLRRAQDELAEMKIQELKKAAVTVSRSSGALFP
jgi:hypothetical protein